jgi:hypothetical protein
MAGADGEAACVVRPANKPLSLNILTFTSRLQLAVRYIGQMSLRELIVGKATAGAWTLCSYLPL